MWTPPQENPILLQESMAQYKQSLFSIDDLELVKQIEEMRRGAFRDINKAVDNMSDSVYKQKNKKIID